MNEPVGLLDTALVECHLERVEDELGPHCVRELPADDLV